MTEIEATQELTRSEVAAYLREFAAELEPSTPGSGARTSGDARTAGDPRTAGDSPGSTDAQPSTGRDAAADDRVTFMVGDDSTTINPPETVSFEVEVDSDDSLVGHQWDHEVSFELSWQSADDEEEETEADLEIR